MANFVSFSIFSFSDIGMLAANGKGQLPAHIHSCIGRGRTCTTISFAFNMFNGYETEGQRVIRGWINQQMVLVHLCSKKKTEVPINHLLLNIKHVF
jgi:hypothetical protein